MAKAKIKTLTTEERLAEALVPESEQPYPLPVNWVWVKGKSCLLPMTTKKPVGATFVYIDIDAIDNVTQAVVRPKQLPVTQAPSRASREVREGDTLFSMVRPYLKNIAYIDASLADCVASTGFFVCRPSCILNGRFLYYLMISGYMVDGLNAFMKGDNSPSIRQENIFVFPFPLPPLPEQHRIIKRIESLFGKLDRAKELVQTALYSFETRKAATLHKAFTGELTTKWREENGIVMASWKETPIEKIGQVKGGKRLPKGETLVNEDTGFPYIKAGDLKQGTVLLDKLQFLVPDIQKSIKNYVVQSGDVYITIVGACIGDVGVIPDALNGANLTENAAKITDLTCYSRYLAFCMNSNNIQAQIKDKIASATLGKLSIKSIMSLLIPLPALPEQQEIVRILDILFEKEQRACELCDVINKIDMMKKTILARAFRGELGTNDPGEESAVGLLQVI